MTAFICKEMRQRVQDGFRILLPEAGAARVFGDKLKPSCITAVPQDHHRPRLVLNLLENPDDGTPSVNDTTGREVIPGSMKF